MSELNQEQLDYLEYCKAQFQQDEEPMPFREFQWLNRVEDNARVIYWPVLGDEYNEFDPWLDGQDDEED